MATVVPKRRFKGRIGIIAGSGPEAGVDLWAKILDAAKSRLGDEYRGDMDAPEVTVFSVPELGLSMELETYDAEVWRVLRETACAIADRVDYYAIACNTLNYYAPRIAALVRTARLVSTAEVVARDIRRRRVARLALLGAKPVMALDTWSPFGGLRGLVDIEIPDDAAALHALIYDVKAAGGDGPGHAERFAAILRTLESDDVVLACTELPLIPLAGAEKRLIDVTHLLADELVRLALDGAAAPPS